MSDANEVTNMSDVSDESLRLDGNAAAGMLEEIFTFEVTSAHCTCAGCGRTAPLGALLLYGGEMGIILRCPECGRAELRVARPWSKRASPTTRTTSELSHTNV